MTYIYTFLNLQKKIEEYKLDETAQPVWAKFKSNPHPEKFAHLSLDIYSYGAPATD